MPERKRIREKESMRNVLNVIEEKQTPAEVLKRRFENFANANPLRVWRIEQGITAVLASTMLQVTVSTLTNWETGQSYPSPDNIEKIGNLTGILDIADVWINWFARFPNVNPAESSEFDATN